MANTAPRYIHDVPALPADFIPTSLSTACTVTPTADPATFHCTLQPDWAVGVVPHGGYLAALITHAARTFSLSQHATLAQGDLITLHQEFISACVFGPAEVRVTVLSRGRQYSTLRVQLFQQPKAGPPILRIEALVRQGSLQRERAAGGVSLPTRPSAAKWPLLARETCVERKDPPGMYERRTAYGKVVFLLGPDTDHVGSGVEGPSVCTQWIRWRDPARHFDDVAALAYLADTHRPLIEAYGLVGNWFPTLNVSLDVKKGPPEGGWEWLFMRIEIHSCVDGRFDYDVVILDETGELVALSKHANLIVSSERNYKRSSAAAAAKM